MKHAVKIVQVTNPVNLRDKRQLPQMVFLRTIIKRVIKHMICSRVVNCLSHAATDMLHGVQFITLIVKAPCSSVRPIFLNAEARCYLGLPLHGRSTRAVDLIKTPAVPRVWSHADFLYTHVTSVG